MLLLTRYASNIQVIYEYIGYMRIHRSNKNGMDYFSLFIFQFYTYQEMWIKFEDSSYCLALQILP